MNELTEMDTEYVYRMLNLLSELPLQQGGVRCILRQCEASCPFWHNGKSTRI